MNKPDKRYCILHGRQTGENLLDFGVLSSIIGQLFEEVFKRIGLEFWHDDHLLWQIYIQKFGDNLKYILEKPEHEWTNWTKDIAFYKESKRKEIYSIFTFLRQI